MPAAIGARAASATRPIFSITGDGGFNMMLGELETARRLKLDFTGVTSIRVEHPNQLEAAIAEALAAKGPVIMDVVVTRDPAKMLPGVDNRAVKVKKGDRIA